LNLKKRCLGLFFHKPFPAPAGFWKQLPVSLIFLCLFSFPAGAAEPSPDSAETPAVEDAASYIKDKPFLVFNEGFSAAWMTRIINQTERSNFVFRDFMPGLYFGMKTVNMQPLNSMVRLSVYYPLGFTFNGVPQYPKNVLRIALDMFGGIDFELEMWRFVLFYFSPGVHFYVQNAVRGNYFNIGIAGLVGLELPVLKNWTLLVNGIVSLDNGNLGSNRHMEPFDIVYQYQLDLGVRYSKRAANVFSYIR
jgi:hypothetical protein